MIEEWLQIFPKIEKCSPIKPLMIKEKVID
jgi:hypothetical protein